MRGVIRRWFRGASWLAIIVLVTTAHAAIPEPSITARSAVVIDADSGRVLYGREEHTQRYPASTTKVLTALLLLEHSGLDEMITAPEDADTVGGSSMHLQPFERVSVRDMLYALMVRSANDGAYATAVHVSGSQEAFSELMNRRAQELGALNSQFNNPHGLNDPDHLTTAFDLAMIARGAIQHPDLAEAAKAQRWEMTTRSLNDEDIVLISRNRLLRDDPTVEGMKTGWTIPAGRCYIGAATREGFRIITVVLHSEDWIADTKALTEWAYAHYSRRPVLNAAAPLGHVWVPELRGSLTLLSQEPLWMTVSDTQRSPYGVRLAIDLPEEGILQGQPAGYARLTFADGHEVQIPVVAGNDLVRPAFIAGATGRPWVWITALGIGTALVIRKVRIAQRRKLRMYERIRI